MWDKKFIFYPGNKILEIKDRVLFKSCQSLVINEGDVKGIIGKMVEWETTLLNFMS